MKNLKDCECVAVIMPAYNCASTLDRAIDSVISQTYKNWKLYVINDKSPEDLTPVLSKYKNIANIVIIENEKNLGAAGSRNVGLLNSDESIIAYLDSDDAWMPGKLEAQVGKIISGKGASITHYYYVAKNRNAVTWRDDKLTVNDFIKKRFRVCFSSLVHKRTSGLQFETIGHEDFVYIYKLIEQFGEVNVIRDELVEYYEMENSLSSHKKTAAKWHFNILKKINPNPVFIISNYLYYIVNGIKFKIINR